jgi:membrane protein DedA with SNARE-associated domain
MLVALGAAIGATAGDTVSYAIGRRWGLPLLKRWRLSRRLVPKAEEAQGWFDRHGGRAVFVGRWIGALRAIVPVVAGTARMPFGRFLAWNVLASLTWAGAAVTLGYLFGNAAARAVERAGIWVYVGVAVAAAAWWIVRRRRAQA